MKEYDINPAIRVKRRGPIHKFLGLPWKTLVKIKTRTVYANLMVGLS